jgi:NAD(P)-dependent dehydrogenase (short-subunit alcohol dehydrogenase family)
MAEKVWFITGSSRGFGRAWTLAALERGDKVVATARDIDSISDLKEKFPSSLLPLCLDVTDRRAVFETLKVAHAHFGRLDVILNNAGFGLFGTIEETTEAQARAQMETNLFGSLWVTQAALPFLRQQGGGHILNVSSISGVVSFPTLGMYQASKWAVEGFTDTLAQEVARFGIKVTLIEPGAYATDWGSISADHAPQMPEYAPVREAFLDAVKDMPIGTAAATCDAIFKVVDCEQPPLRLFLGTLPFPIVSERYAERLAEWEEWADVANAAQG